MNDVPVELVVAAFTDEQGADRALEELKRAKKEKLIGIRNAAVITRDANDNLHIRELRDMGAGKGAGVGALVGGAIGLLFPPSLLAAGAVGAAVGGLGAKLRDAGFRDDRLKELGKALKPGTSAIVAVIEHRWVADLEQELAAQGARIVEQAITEDIAQKLEAGQSVAYMAIADKDSLVLGRMVEEPAGSTNIETSLPAEAPVAAEASVPHEEASQPQQ
jgi:uncharacterized membrane protein